MEKQPTLLLPHESVEKPQTANSQDSHDPDEKIADNVVVVFKLSEERAKIKKKEAKERRDFLRDRLSAKSTG